MTSIAARTTNPVDSTTARAISSASVRVGEADECTPGVRVPEGEALRAEEGEEQEPARTRGGRSGGGEQRGPRHRRIRRERRLPRTASCRRGEHGPRRCRRRAPRGGSTGGAVLHGPVPAEVDSLEVPARSQARPAGSPRCRGWTIRKSGLPAKTGRPSGTPSAFGSPSSTGADPIPRFRRRAGTGRDRAPPAGWRTRSRTARRRAGVEFDSCAVAGQHEVDELGARRNQRVRAYSMG